MGTSHRWPCTRDRGPSLLPQKRQADWKGNTYPQDSTKEFGQETMDKAAEIAIKEAHHRLNNPHLYLGHGLSLREGLWKEEESMNNIQRELVDYIKGHPIINTHSTISRIISIKL